MQQKASKTHEVHRQSVSQVLKFSLTELMVSHDQQCSTVTIRPNRIRSTKFEYDS